MRRRQFLACAAAAGGLSFIPLGSAAWAARSESASQKRLVVVFLRGAVDGLNVVIPYTEQEYYAMRPTIAIARPGRPGGGALLLDDRFGLHPALATLLPVWKEKSLAFVHASGSPDESRSHFDAQAFMETGTPGVRTTPDGWMNRVLAALPGPHPTTEAVNFGKTVARILGGSMPVASISPSDYNDAGGVSPQESALGTVFDRLYAGADPLSVAYHEGRAAHSQLMSDLGRDMTEAAGGAPSAKGFPQDAEKLCALVKGDPRIKLAFFALSGWDTHVNQGGAEGQLANHLKALGEGLAALRGGLGSHYDDTIVLVVSEFGRTAHENGSGGTDHGHGNALWAMGGPVAGGKVYGEWPGLDEEGLHEGRDLAVTTDFRTVIGGVVQRHLAVAPDRLAHVFPSAPAGTAVDLLRV